MIGLIVSFIFMVVFYLKIKPILFWIEQYQEDNHYL